MVRAARLFFERSHIPPGVHIHLEKRIPHGAGLGGGSSDAATALVALNKMLGRGLNLSELIHIGSKLGADVPFFLAQSTAKVSGFGEAVTVVPSPEPVDVVLIKRCV